MKELKSKTMMKKAVMINGTNIEQNFIRRDRTNMAELKKWGRWNRLEEMINYRMKEEGDSILGHMVLFYGHLRQQTHRILRKEKTDNQNDDYQYYHYNFAVRYINTTLPTNSDLTKWKLSSTPDCSFCKNDMAERSYTRRHDSPLPSLTSTLQSVKNSTTYADLPILLKLSILTRASLCPDLLLSTASTV